MIQSVDRAIRILLALQGARHLSLSELASRLDLPVSTVHGLAKSLAVHGMVQQDGAGRYVLGPAVLRLSSVYLDTLELRSRTLNWSGELARRTGCAVRIGVPLLEQVIIIHHEPRPDGSRQMPEVGIVIPSHACALGKAILAFSPELSETLLAGGGLRSMTGDTIADGDRLREELARITETAIATERDEAVLGESGVAAPVFDNTRAVVGSVGLVMPTTDWPPQDAVLDHLRETARNISRELGSDRWPVPTGAER